MVDIRTVMNPHKRFRAIIANGQTRFRVSKIEQFFLFPIFHMWVSYRFNNKIVGIFLNLKQHISQYAILLNITLWRHVAQ